MGSEACATLACCSSRHHHGAGGCAIPLFCRRHPRDGSCVWQGPLGRNTLFLERKPTTTTTSATEAADYHPPLLHASSALSWRSNATAAPGGCGARKVFVDLGANDGQSLRWFARRHFQPPAAGSGRSAAARFASSAPFTAVVLFEMNPAFEAALLAELACLPPSIGRYTRAHCHALDAIRSTAASACGRLVGFVTCCCSPPLASCLRVTHSAAQGARARRRVGERRVDGGAAAAARLAHVAQARHGLVRTLAPRHGTRRPF